MFLDATGIAPAVFRRRFPTVSAACRAAGVDPTRQPIPVAPAAHYHCGGVRHRPGRPRPRCPACYAVGEVARTGLHGANRLASNSLLEGLVMGERAAAAVRADGSAETSRPAELILTPAPAPIRPVGPELQAAMSSSAGIGRDRPGCVGRAVRRARCWRAAAPLDRAAVEAANLALAARGAARRRASCGPSRVGCHVRTDHPDRSAGSGTPRRWCAHGTAAIEVAAEPAVAAGDRQPALIRPVRR